MSCINHFAHLLVQFVIEIVVTSCLSRRTGYAVVFRAKLDVEHCHNSTNHTQSNQVKVGECCGYEAEVEERHQVASTHHVDNHRITNHHDHATGDILGRFDADCMIRPDWVEVVSGIFTEDPDAMGATGPVMYYDLPSRHFGLRGDNSTRKRIYRADDGQPLLFGSNMALRATAWREIADEVCQDKADVMHEDIDISLHLLGKDLKTVYCPRMIAGISARRMDTSPASFLNYMRRFKNTFNAHPQHYRKHKPEILITALYPVMHLLYPVWQKVLNTADINPAEAAWINEQMELAEQEGHELYDDTPTDEEWSEKHEE